MEETDEFGKLTDQTSRHYSPSGDFIGQETDPPINPSIVFAPKHIKPAVNKLVPASEIASSRTKPSRSANLFVKKSNLHARRQAATKAGKITPAHLLTESDLSASKPPIHFSPSGHEASARRDEQNPLTDEKRKASPYAIGLVPLMWSAALQRRDRALGHLADP